MDTLSAEIADQTDARGVYTLTASDQAAHVLPLSEQAAATTSFTGELLDLVRAGILGGPEHLTLGMLYLHLRQRCTGAACLRPTSAVLTRPTSSSSPGTPPSGTAKPGCLGQSPAKTLCPRPGRPS